MATRKTNVVRENKILCNEPLLKDMAGIFNSILNNVPEQYRDIARCYISKEKDADEYCYLNVRVAYCYPETKEEAKQRRAAEKLKRQEIKEKELNQLRELLIKHPNANKGD